MWDREHELPGFRVKEGLSCVLFRTIAPRKHATSPFLDSKTRYTLLRYFNVRDAQLKHGPETFQFGKFMQPIIYSLIEHTNENRTMMTCPSVLKQS